MMPILACWISFLLACALLHRLDNDELKERQGKHSRIVSRAAVIQSAQRSGRDASTALGLTAWIASRASGSH
jgi:hypothetical protein